MDLVRVMTPARRHRAGSRGISDRYPASDEFGAVGVLAALAKAGTLISSGAAGAKRLQLGEKLRAWSRDEKRRNEVYERRYKASKRRYERARSKASKARHLKQMRRYEELLEIARTRARVASAGIVPPGEHLDGVAIELRRNALAKEYESADPGRKAYLQTLIARYDKDLAKRKADLLAVQKLREAQQAAAAPAAPAPAPPATPKGSQAQTIPREPELDDTPPAKVDETPASDLLKDALDGMPPLTPGQAAVTGVGGLMAVAQAPPGPGQQVRVTFYPTLPAQSYSGAGGIDEPGDDPILLMTGTFAAAGQAFLRLRPSRIQTDFFTYGKYRLLGVVTHYQNSYVVRTAAVQKTGPITLQGVAIVLRGMSVYNGEDIFLPDLGAVSVDTYSVFPTPDAYAGASGIGLVNGNMQESPYNARRSTRHFIGLRTNPVIEGTARIQATVGAYCWVSTPAGGPAPNTNPGDFIEIPVSVSLVCQVLEDKVFGNPIVVGPAARAGAQVNLGLADEGLDAQGVRQYVLKNPRYTPPKEG